MQNVTWGQLITLALWSSECKMSLGHRCRNSISCSDFLGENVNRQIINRYPKGQWWPFILTPIYTYVTYALVRHLFENRNALFKRKMSNNAFFFNIAMMKIPWGPAFWGMEHHWSVWCVHFSTTPKRKNVTKWCSSWSPV